MATKGAGIDLKWPLGNLHISFDDSQPCVDDIVLDNNPVGPAPIRVPLCILFLDDLKINDRPGQPSPYMPSLGKKEDGCPYDCLPSLRFDNESPFEQEFVIVQGFVPAGLTLIEATAIPRQGTLIKEGLWDQRPAAFRYQRVERPHPSRIVQFLSGCNVHPRRRDGCMIGGYLP